MRVAKGAMGETWIDHAAKLAENANTRHRVFDDPLLISQLVDTVKRNAAGSRDSSSNNGTSRVIHGKGKTSHQMPTSQSRASRSDHLAERHPDRHDCRGGAEEETARRAFSRSQDLPQDPAFDAPPPQASPVAASALCRVFTFLRNSCVGCPANNRALRHTGLAEAALQFAVDQAPFACGAATSHPAATMDCNKGVEARVGGTSDVRLAVRAGLQFACNYCVGGEENKALLWADWFPRGLMELVNGLKTDRGLLSLAVALIHTCCASPPPCEGRGDGCGDRGSTAEHGEGIGAERETGKEEEGGGRERLGRLVADRAFCCLLVKVVVPRSASNSVVGELDHDPAREWLYLLFCSLVQEGLCRDVFDNVGIRAGGRQRQPRPRRPQSGGAVVEPSTEEMVVERREEGHDAVDVGGSARVSTGAAGLEGLDGKERKGGRGDEEAEAEEDDFFFPVTPEQLIVLNLAEIAAADEAVTGGERPNALQRQACAALLGWLAGLLSAMPLSQTLLPPTDTSPVPPAVKKPAAELPQRTTPSPTSTEGQNEDVVVDEVSDVETERVRRSMREEARSATLRALAALLSGCGDETRQLTAAKVATSASAVAIVPSKVAVEPPPATAGFVAQHAQTAAEAKVVGSIDEDASAARGVPRALGDVIGRGKPSSPEQLPPTKATQIAISTDAQPETRLVPLCLRLLDGCGEASRPKPKVASRSDTISSTGGSATPGATTTRAGGPSPVSNDHGVAGVGRARAASTLELPGGVPAGRKVELLKVIGNACFRCRSSQDLAREEGGLLLVLNHCAVDSENPLLREYALLAVRNLCEGNSANQAAIASLRPQGCTPGMDEALADMGLEGHVNSKGQFSVRPRPATSPC